MRHSTMVWIWGYITTFYLCAGILSSILMYLGLWLRLDANLPAWKGTAVVQMRNVISSKCGTRIPLDFTWIFTDEMVKSQRVESWNCLPTELHISVGVGGGPWPTIEIYIVPSCSVMKRQLLLCSYRWVLHSIMLCNISNKISTAVTFCCTLLLWKHLQLSLLDMNCQLWGEISGFQKKRGYLVGFDMG